MSKKEVADAILHLSYSEMMDFVNDLVAMQKGDISFQPDDPYGPTGLAQMMFSWADWVNDQSREP